MTLRNTLAAFGVLVLATGLTPALADNGKAKGHGATQANVNGNSSANGKAVSGSRASHGNSAKHLNVAANSIPSKKGLASELKGLNAVKANPNALENASPNSQVGRIALYRDAALATNEVADILEEKENALDDLLLDAPRDELLIQASIDTTQGLIDGIVFAIAAALLVDPFADVTQLEADRLAAVGVKAGYEQELLDAAAQNLLIDAARDEVDAAQLEVDAAQGLEDDALLVASKGRDLSEAAIAYIRAVLGL